MCTCANVCRGQGLSIIRCLSQSLFTLLFCFHVVCVCLLVCGHIHGCTGTWIHIPWRLQFVCVIGNYPPLLFYLIQLNPELTDVAGLSSQLSLEMHCLCLPSLEFQPYYQIHSAFICVPRVLVSVLMCEVQAH